MNRIFVLTNHKGGVGKSTSATNIAFGLTMLLRRHKQGRHRVLVIDTDSQAHATLVTTGKRNFGADNSLYSPLMADRRHAPKRFAECIVQSQWDENLHIIPASQSLDQAERELTGTAGAPYRLADALSHIAGHYTAIVIDTRPSFSLLTEMALIAATDAIVPVEPKYLETVGLMNVIDKVNEIRDGWRVPHLRLSGILVTKMDRRVRGHHHLLQELQAHPYLGQLVCGTIPMNEAVSYAHRNHESVLMYDPTASASMAYAQLAGQLYKRLGAQNGT